MSRDYAQEVRAIVDAEFQDGDAAPLVAARIVAKLEATDPDLLSGWLHAQAVLLLTQEIRQIDVRQRQHARTQTRRGAFHEAAAGEEPGRAVSGFLDLRYVVNEDGQRYRLAAMTANDLRFVADGYEATSRRAQVEAAFFRALAKKVGTKTVGERFTEQQIRDLRSSLGAAAA